MSGGGGGGSTQIQLRNPKQEQPTVGNWYDFQRNQYGDFLNNNPLLNTATAGALQNYGGLGGLTQPLAALQGQAPGFYGGLQGQLQGYGNTLGGLSGNIRSLLGSLPNVQNLLGPLGKTFSGLGQDFSNVYQPVIAGGGYSPQIGRLGSQSARIAASAAGAAHTPGAIGQEVLQRQDVMDQRLANYSNLANQAAATQSGLGGSIQNILGANTGLRSGLLGQIGQLTQGQAGIAGQQGGLFSQQGALSNLLSSGVQGLQSGGLNQLTGVGQSGVSQFSALTNPILGYLGNLFSNNLQGQIAQAGINAQANQAANNKQAGGITGAISAIGPILGAVASDERLKTKIRGTGLKTHEGVPLKTWEYKSKPGIRFLSPIAQDVEKKMPDRVLTDPRSGLKSIVGFPVIQVSPPRKE